MSKLWEERPVIVENTVENSFYVLEEPSHFGKNELMAEKSAWLRKHLNNEQNALF